MADWLPTTQVPSVGLLILVALLWWRMRNIEKEVMRLRDDRHSLGNKVATLKGRFDEHFHEEA